MKALESTTHRSTAAAKLIAQISALNNAIDYYYEAHLPQLIEIRNEKQAQLDYLNSNKTWNFNFVGGGWNTVSAPDMQTAIKLAEEKYNETEQRYHCEENGGGAIPLMKVDTKTFRVATEADTKNLLSLFY